MQAGISSKNRLIILLCMLISMSLTFSCGGPGPDPQPGSGKGTVALFITDNMSFYKQVVSTITGVRLINSGTAEVCELLEEPVTVDIANLTNMAQYAALADCPEGSYNRIDIDIKKDVRLMDQLGTASACAFTSFFDESGQTQPLVCDPVTGICTLSAAGGKRGGTVLVQEDLYNDLGIDFDLKKFTVTEFGNPSTCSVTMAVYPVSAVDMNSSGRAHSATGGITDLDNVAETFILTAGTTTLLVDYSGINPSLQPNLDRLLVAAQKQGLLVNVQTGDVDLATNTLSANRLFVKASGTVDNVEGAPEWSFELETRSGTVIDASFKPPADVQGVLVDGAWVNVKFDGYDAKHDEYIASSIEVLPAGTVIDD